MMNFYYDPILGLQYKYLVENVLLDIKALPENFKLEEFLEEWRASFNLYWDTGVNFYPQVKLIGRITTDFI